MIHDEGKRKIESLIKKIMLISRIALSSSNSQLQLTEPLGSQSAKSFNQLKSAILFFINFPA